MGWVVNATPRPPYTQETDPVPTIPRTWGWEGPKTGLDWCGNSRPHQFSIPGPSGRSQSLHQLRYPGQSTGRSRR